MGERDGRPTRDATLRARVAGGRGGVVHSETRRALLHLGTALMSLSRGECSAKLAPVLTLRMNRTQSKYMNSSACASTTASS